MCGIAGFCDFKLQSNESMLGTMTRSLAHRGPDDEGLYFNVESACQIGLGHRRLSIIDVSASGHQPMVSECGQYLVIFNGEIYNYKELKAELVKKGFQFRTNSDTEVLLNLYKQSPKQFLNELRGMFAFVILDRKENKVVAVRDRVGVKPFYYYFSEGLFLFGSELKALTRHPGFSKEINIHGLSDYFKYGYIGGEKTIYENTYKLKKGHHLELNLKTGELRADQYWNIADYFGKPKLKGSYLSVERELTDRFKEAFNYRLVSDVPVGIFLSGGYDSTLVTSILVRELNQKLTTFTVGFEEKEVDESVQAKKIAALLGTEHETLMCSENDAQYLVNRLPLVYDEPFSDPSAIPTLLVSKMAASKVKVVLSADGGDENFCGYNRYKSYYDRINTFKGAFNTLRRKIGQTVGPYFPEPTQPWVNIFTGDISAYLNKANSHLSATALSGLLQVKVMKDQNGMVNTTEPFDQMLLWDMEHYLPDDVLVKVDRASMAFGLESREPLLDHRLMEYVAQIPFEFKLQKGVLKYPVKSIVHKYIDRALMDNPKKGFSPPLKTWITETFNDEFNDLTSEPYLRRQGILNTQFLYSFIRQIKSDYLRHRFMWSVFIFQKWYQTWIKA